MVGTRVPVFAVGRDEALPAVCVLAVGSAVAVVIAAVVTDLGRPRVDERIRIVAVVPPAGFTHIRIPIGIHGKTGTGSARAGVLHGAGIPVVAGIGVVRVLAEPRYAIIVRTFIRIVAIRRDGALPAVCVLAVGSAVTVVIAAVVTDLGRPRVYIRIRVVTVPLGVGTAGRRGTPVPVPIQIRTRRPRLLPQEEHARQDKNPKANKTCVT
jgi:hypothetical protein